jgi:DNA (cytosine-5)-methyltransferase 1
VIIYYEVEEMPKYLDLFAGAGGLSEGFTRAGYEPMAHVEMDVGACYTLRTRAAYHWLKKENKLDIYNRYLNGLMTRDEFYNEIPKSVLDTVLNYEISSDTLPQIFDDVDKILGGHKLDLIIGGPPCQAYSLAGRSRSETKMVGDKRNYLYKYYAECLRRYRPKYFVFENVLGLLSAKDEDGSLHFENMRRLFAEYGYSTEFRHLNASDYGVLQNRKRIILIGKLGTEENDFYPEIPKSASDHKVGELFCDLPSIPAGGGTITPISTNPYTGKYLIEAGIKEYDSEPVTFHQARPNTKQDLEIYRIVVDTWNKTRTRIAYTDLPAHLRTHNNTKCFLDRFKVVAGNLTCAQTVVAHICRDGHYYIHPDIKQNRSLTPREAARIQTFPDNYYFESASGKPSRTLAYKQIGNAVPVLLAYRIAEALKDRFIKDDHNG